MANAYVELLCPGLLWDENGLPIEGEHCPNTVTAVTAPFCHACHDYATREIEGDIKQCFKNQYTRLRAMLGVAGANPEMVANEWNAIRDCITEPNSSRLLYYRAKQLLEAFVLPSQTAYRGK
jgi:hypothetical protein